MDKETREELNDKLNSLPPHLLSRLIGKVKRRIQKKEALDKKVKKTRKKKKAIKKQRK